MARKATPEPRDYFRATGAELREWSATDPNAAAEAARRKAKRAAKSATRAAAAA